MENQTIYQEPQKDGLTFKDIGLFLKKALPLMIVCVLICCLIVTMVGLIFKYATGKSISATGTISLTSVGIDEGLTPTGLPYNKDDIRSTQIVSTALSNLNLGYAAKDVRNAITVSGVVPDAYAKMLEELKKAGKLTPEELEKLAYHPTSFNVSIKTQLVKDLSQNDARNIVDEIMKIYIKRFQTVYFDNAAFETPVISDAQIEAADFVESLSVINSQMEQVKSHINKMASKNGEFIGSNNVSFASISSQLNLLDKQYRLILSNIKNGGYARDAQGTIAYLSTQISDLDSTITTKKATLLEIEKFIKNFKEQYPTIDFGGSGTPGGSINITIPQSEAFQTMFLRQLAVAEEIEKLSIEKLNLTNWKTQIEANKIPVNEEKIAEITNQIISIKNDFVGVLKTTNIALKEYQQVESYANANIASEAVVVSTGKNVPWLVMFVVAIIGGVFLGMVLTPVISKLKATRLAKKAAEIAPTEDTIA